MSSNDSTRLAARLIARHEEAVKKTPPAQRGERGRFAQRGSGAQKINDELRRAMGRVVDAGPGAPAAPPPRGSRARPLAGGAATHHSGSAGPTSSEVSADIVRQIKRSR